MSVSPQDVKELRDKTQAGMMDCKKALQEASGNMEAAIEILRKKGMALAKKKWAREAREGILGTYYDPSGKLGLLVEVNCETDFVIQTPDFQNFVKKAASLIREKAPQRMEELREMVQDDLTSLVAKIGENIQVRRFEHWKVPNSETTLGFYLHAGSKIGVLVQIADPEHKIPADLSKELAMHIAAMHPRYLRPEEIPAETLEKEKEILLATIDAKKPREVQQKIVEGKLKKFYAEECLEDQIFVKDPQGKKTVAQWLKGIAPKARIERFVRLQVGA
ncbi:MAG: elongation factor Ts [Deltaproteobacteria bacterium]|nr:elongation factor Ts [Deltaproteobacteria bacterium]